MKKVLFYPDPPVQLPGHTLSKTIDYFVLLGYKLTNDINDNWDIAVHWDIKDINQTSQMLLDDSRLVLNKRCNNITKSYVDKMFTRVFGYSSMANTTGFGCCVKKGEGQSVHNGVIIKTPCEKEDGYIYQLLIDNRIDVDMVYDIRVPIFLGKIPLVFIKCKTIEGTFEYTFSKKLKYWVSPLPDYLSKDEINKIIMFSSLIGMDVGEIDALRDNSTGRLYLIDVNNIPGGNVFNHIEDGNRVRRQLSLFLKNQLDANT